MNIPFCLKVTDGDGQTHYGDAAVAFKTAEAAETTALSAEEIAACLVRLRARIQAEHPGHQET